MERIIQSLLVENNYFDIPKDSLNLQLLSHPEYPSIKSITDTLDYFEIENLAANVPVEALDQMPNSFLALIKESQESDIVLVQQKKTKIELIDSEQKKKTVAKEAFQNIWEGTLVAIEKKEKTINAKNITTYLPVILFGTAIIALAFYQFSIPFLLYFITTLFGLYISVLIVKEDLGIHNKTVAKVCSSISKNSNCSEVIGAKGSSIFSVSLSDASIVTFSSLLLMITLIGFNPTVLYAFGIAAIPVILYSFYQQGIVLKTWCALCLVIASLLLLQFAILTFMTQISWNLNSVYILKSLTIVTAMSLGWYYMKSFWTSHEKLAKTETEFMKFKRNQQLFETLLHKEKVISNAKIPETHIVSFGNPNAPIRLQAVSNPLCGFCTDAFYAYDALLKNHTNAIRLDYIFNVPLDTKNKATQIVATLLEKYQKHPKDCYEGLKEWFSHRSIEKWDNKYGEVDILKTKDIIESHANWCNLNAIHYTPATLINDYVFPKEYTIKDLPLFIQDLILKYEEQ